MREIKFRFWHKIAKCWEDDLLTTSPYYQNPFSRDDIIVSQWTGLLDKNGVEIYGGDIVAHGYLGCIRGEVTWGDYGWEVINQAILGREDSYGNSYFQHPDAYKIIGNIYENLELLGKA